MLIKQRFVHWRSDTPLLPAVSLITPAYFAAGDTNVGIGPISNEPRLGCSPPGITSRPAARMFPMTIRFRKPTSRGSVAVKVDRRSEAK
jgi:hypothetical protein